MNEKQDITQKQLNDILDDFLNSSKAIELSIATTVTEANNEIEIVLKELLVYLNTTSRNLEKIQDKVEVISDKVSGIEDIEERLKDNSDKIDDLPKEVNAILAQSIAKVVEEFKTINKSSIQLMNAVGAYVKSIYMVTKNVDQFMKLQKEDIQEIKSTLEELSKQVQKTNQTVEKNQNNLMSVIKDLLSINNTSKSNEVAIEGAKVEVEKAKVQAEETKVKSSADALKSKYQLIGKIAALILGSGGVIYMIVDFILKSSIK